MQKVKIILLAVLTLGVQVENVQCRSKIMGKKQLQQYKPLKVNEGRKPASLKLAKLSDVHLAKAVKYFDIKQYDASGRYIGGWSFDMAAYKKLSGKDKKKIRSARAKKPKNTFWKLFFADGTFAGFYNLHYIDSHSKIQTINSRKDLLSFLGTVDTPAELSMLLLGDSNGKIRYRKMGNSYNLRINDVSYSDCDGCGEPACTLFVRQKIMDNRGAILLDRQVSEKSFKNEKKCRKF
ncbi:hypothetical protein MNB_SV-10-196 [hydrothermal vent metagenome]|uniref:Uncharacterized protein n=1 Tax=hydrothermal vent metagenome TaxID=652676 RepID=A0A1W1C8G8_9ZZZZ